MATNFVQLSNGNILANPAQLDALLATRKTKIIRAPSTQQFISQLIAEIHDVYQDWQLSGQPLDKTTITVAQMFTEISNILERCEVDANQLSFHPAARRYTGICYQCHRTIETDIDPDGDVVCPCCENTIHVSTPSYHA